MTTISAVADITNASVLLTINKTAVISHVTRTDVNGTVRVRVPAYTLPSAGMGTLYLFDYEAAHGANTYRVYHAGSSQVPTTTVTVRIDSPWLFVPVLPHLSVTVTQVSTFQSSRTSSTVVHRVLERAEPVIKMGKLGLREGSLDILCEDYLSTRVLDDAITSGEVLMLRQNVPGLDLYFVALGSDVQPLTEDGSLWRYSARFQQVERPEGLLKSARGWNYGELASSFNTYAEVTAAYASYNTLLINEEV